jgi:hypothetical protein
MTERTQLADLLERHYRDAGWRVERSVDGTVRADGPGGVTWIGLAVVHADLEEERFAGRLLSLSEERMPTGQLCPFELLPAADCADELRRLLVDLRLAERGHVEVYSLAA